MKLPAAILLLALPVCAGQLEFDTIAQPPPLVLPTNPPSRYSTNCPLPRPQIVITNVVLSWGCYTDAWYEVDATTNLLDTNGWYLKTNVPIWCTNVTIPVTGSFELYRMRMWVRPVQ